MQKEYIVKLVFDKSHECVVILQNSSKVIGGICFREFKQEMFAEISFLAITSNMQIKGFGSRLMNKLKGKKTADLEEMQKRKIQYLVTYADSQAIGYFRKQGFTKKISMSAERLKGCKRYEGGTMMECHINPVIDYSQLHNFAVKSMRQTSGARVKTKRKD